MARLSVEDLAWVEVRVETRGDGPMNFARPRGSGDCVEFGLDDSLLR